MEVVEKLMSNWEAIVGSVATLIVVLQHLSKQLGKWWNQTPGTPDTELFSKVQKYLKRAQRFVALFSGDTAKDEGKRRGDS